MSDQNIAIEIIRILGVKNLHTCKINNVHLINFLTLIKA